jgi:hypothetical protein
LGLIINEEKTKLSEIVLYTSKNISEESDSKSKVFALQARLWPRGWVKI